MFFWRVKLRAYIYSIRALRHQCCFDPAVFSLTTTTAAIPALAHLSQRAYEEDSGSTHICFRSQAICCKCVCDGSTSDVCVWCRWLKERVWMCVISRSHVQHIVASLVLIYFVTHSVVRHRGKFSSQRRLVSWSHGSDTCRNRKDEWSEKMMMTSSHITWISLRFFLSLAVVLQLFQGFPPTEHLNKGSIHKVSRAPEDVVRLQAWGCSSSHPAITPVLLAICQVDVTL